MIESENLFCFFGMSAMPFLCRDVGLSPKYTLLNLCSAIPAIRYVFCVQFIHFYVHAFLTDWGETGSNLSQEYTATQWGPPLYISLTICVYKPYVINVIYPVLHIQ